MLTRAQTANLLGVLATASIVSVGYAIGGTIGASVMASIGINLSSAIIQQGSLNLKARWLSSESGILNHDIQNALTRAFVAALTHLEEEYFKTAEAHALAENEKASIRQLFLGLKKQAPHDFASSLDSAAKEQDVINYLSATQETSTDRLWEQIRGATLLSTYNEDFKNFLHRNLLNEVQFWFGEELKKDNRESNKAWRAFQRLLLEGIQADIKAVQASQDLIRQDLQNLEKLSNQLDRLRDTIDHGLPVSVYLDGKSATQVRHLLDKVVRAAMRTGTVSSSNMKEIKDFRVKIHKAFKMRYDLGKIDAIDEDKQKQFFDNSQMEMINNSNALQDLYRIYRIYLSDVRREKLDNKKKEVDEAHDYYVTKIKTLVADNGGKSPKKIDGNKVGFFDYLSEAADWMRLLFSEVDKELTELLGKGKKRSR